LFLLLKGKAGVKFGQVNFGSSHHGDFTANLCALGVYLYIGLFERNKNLIYKGIFIVALAAMLYVIMQLASRNGLLSFAFISMISVYLVLKNRGIGVKVLVAMLGIFVGIGALYLFQDSPTIQRAIYQTEVKGGGDRLFYWSSGVKAISEEPFFGFGGDETSSLYAVAKYAPEVEDHVMHNTFLEAGVEYGLIGLTFFLILVFTIIRWSYRNFRYAIATDNLILAAPGISYLISIFAGLFISRIWESTLWYNMSLVFAIGILWVYPSKVFSRVNKYQRNFSVPRNFDQKMLT
jgi:O-antigen ligase